MITAHSRTTGAFQRLKQVLTYHLTRRMASSFDCLEFVNVHLKDIPVDKDKSQTHRQVKGYGYVHVEPTPVTNPRLVASSLQALRIIGLQSPQDTNSSDFISHVSGCKLPSGSVPVAHAYCGHQYGVFSGQLGDGAAMSLGTVEVAEEGIWEVQVKGSGRTPFSRPGTDGRKVLRSSIREFLCSEAMHHLGVPTTRAATCVATDIPVLRDVHYTGEKKEERAALVTRLAPSFLRVGSLEVCLDHSPEKLIPAPSPGDTNLLKALLDYTIKYFYPQVRILEREEDRYLAFYEELIRSTAALVAKWQTIGFCHGVLNTDNISLLGLTIDYGPFAFMETFDPDHISNGSDFWAKFTYQSQPGAIRWCLDKLADVISLVVSRDALKEKLEGYDAIYEDSYNKLMKQKLGLMENQEDDSALFSQLFDTMYHTGSDMTLTFRALRNMAEGGETLEKILKTCCSLTTFKSLYTTRTYATAKDFLLSQTVLGKYPQLLTGYQEENKLAVDRLNNRDIIQYAQGLEKETKAAEDRRLWSLWLEKYEERLTLEKSHTQEERTKIMKENNPRFVLKNYILQEAIEAAEGGDYQLVHVLQTMIETPYMDDPTEQVAGSPELHQVAQHLLALHDKPAGKGSLRIT